MSVRASHVKLNKAGSLQENADQKVKVSGYPKIPLSKCCVSSIAFLTQTQTKTSSYLLAWKRKLKTVVDGKALLAIKLLYLAIL